jgi:hypothetical protein
MSEFDSGGFVLRPPVPPAPGNVYQAPPIGAKVVPSSGFPSPPPGVTGDQFQLSNPLFSGTPAYAAGSHAVRGMVFDVSKMSLPEAKSKLPGTGATISDPFMMDQVVAGFDGNDGSGM